MTEQSKLEWTEYKSRFRAGTTDEGELYGVGYTLPQAGYAALAQEAGK